MTAAGWWRRAAAAAIDLLLIFALGALVGLIAYPFVGNDPVTTTTNNRGEITYWDAAELVAIGTWLLVAATYPWLWTARHDGRTVGKRALGIRVVRHDDEAFGFARAARRELVCKGALALLWGMPLLLSFLWALWDPRGRALHDHMAGTRVVRS